MGILALADQLRPENRQPIAGLRAVGIQHVSLLRGDNRAVAFMVYDPSARPSPQAKDAKRPTLG